MMYSVEQALDKKQTTCVNGIFVILVFLSHFCQYEIMKWAFIPQSIGQLMVAPFLFYSGYGIMEQIRIKNKSYIDNMPKHRILRFYMHFCMVTLLYLSLSIILNKHYSFSRIILSFIGWDSIGNSNWYVFAILMLYWIVYISFKIDFNSGLKYCFFFMYGYVLVISCLKPDYWYNTIFCFLAGMVFSKNKSLIKQPVNWSVLIGLFLFLELFNYRIIAYEILSILFCMSLVLICCYIRIENKILTFLGSHVFEIYILQRIPMIVFKPYLHGYLYLFVCFIITIIIAVLFKKVKNLSVKTSNINLSTKKA